MEMEGVEVVVEVVYYYLDCVAAIDDERVDGAVDHGIGV